MESRIGRFDEPALWKALRSGADPAAREQIALHYVHLVKYVINRLTALSQLETEVVDYDDLYSTGILGLLSAIDHFDPGREVKFITYAVPRIRGAIIDSLRAMDWLPRSLRQEVSRLREAQARLEMRLGRAPDEEELAAELGAGIDEVRRALLAASRSAVLSLDEDQSFSEDGSTTLAGITPARRDDPRDDLHRQQVVRILEDSIRNLPDKERDVVVMYYHREMTFREIGMVLDVTESRVCQLHGKAMLRLKNRLAQIASDLTSLE